MCKIPNVNSHNVLLLHYFVPLLLNSTRSQKNKNKNTFHCIKELQEVLYPKKESSRMQGTSPLFLQRKTNL